MENSGLSKRIKSKNGAESTEDTSTPAALKETLPPTGPSTVTGRRERAPRRPESHPDFAFPWLFILVALAVFALSFLFKERLDSVVPKTYAVCSKEGSIYTVDESKPRVECIVVHGSKIIDTGSAGE